MEKLLYINNYNCTTNRRAGYPNNHLWGIDKLCSCYDVTCAQVPRDVVRMHFKGSGTLNNLYKSFVMFFKYRRYPVVYAACGELTSVFALANLLHLGHRRLYMIQHHGTKGIPFAKGYARIVFISSFVFNVYQHIKNKINVNWGGDFLYAEKFKKGEGIEFDFISAGKSGRDHRCMIRAANEIDAKTVIVAAVNDEKYDSGKITVFSGGNPKKNSCAYNDVFELYAKSRFIVIPIVARTGKSKKALSGLTTFVDAVVMNKPVLVSDSANMGIDIKGLGIGLEYRAGDVMDMKKQMQRLLSLPEPEYRLMCENMRGYSLTHNYEEFCKEIVDIVK